MSKQAVITPKRPNPQPADAVTTQQNLVAQVVQAVPPSPPPYNDVWIYRLVVGGLGLVVLVSVIGAIILSVVTRVSEPPQILTGLGSAAVGALAGLLAPFSSQRAQ